MRRPMHERGRLETMPMGYLLSGPVGTGKTFLAECYAGSIGIPCVKRIALIDNRSEVGAADLEAALKGFIPSADSEEKELQILAAIIEATDLMFLPEGERHRLTTPDGRREVMRRFTALKSIV